MAAVASDPIPDYVDALDEQQRARNRTLDALALAIVERRDQGESVRSLAELYGVAPSAVHSWTKRGRALREQGERRRRVYVRPGAPSAIIPVPLQWAIVVVIVASFVANLVDIVLLLLES